MNWISSIIHKLVGITPYRLIHHRNLHHLKQKASYHASDDAIAEHLRRTFALAGIRCVLDVGANDGAYARFLRDKVGFEGLIVSIEPLTCRFRELEKAALDDPEWLVMHCALGATSGRAVINIMKSDVFSSFHKPSHDHIKKYDEANVVVDTEEVVIRTVAEVHAELAAQRGVGRFYLKMDTQGFDLEVFRGAVPVLHQVPALQSELSFVPIYKDAPSQHEALILFSAHGYEHSLIVPLSFDSVLRMIECDCVMVHPQRMLDA
jgi:FkbM family methyltransferase